MKIKNNVHHFILTPVLQYKWGSKGFAHSTSRYSYAAVQLSKKINEGKYSKKIWIENQQHLRERFPKTRGAT